MSLPVKFEPLGAERGEPFFRAALAGTLMPNRVALHDSRADLSTSDSSTGAVTYNDRWDIQAAVVDQELDLVVVDDDGAVGARLAVRFRSRMAGAEVILLSGHDESDSIRVSIQGNIKETAIRIDVGAEFDFESPPRLLIPALAFLDALSTGARIALQDPVNGTELASSADLPAGVDVVSEDFTTVVRALARLQRRAGVEFPIPVEMTVVERNELLSGIALLDGGTVQGTWTSAAFDVDETQIDFLLCADSGLEVEVEAPMEISLGGRTLNLGIASYRFSDAVLSSVADSMQENGKKEVVLKSGSENVVSVSLIGVDEAAHGSAHQPSVDILRHYAGQWIAHIGDRIIAHGSTPAAVVADPRYVEERGTVWKVPATQGDAEFAPVDI